MALAILYSRTQAGLTAAAVTVEVHLANGLPQFALVGLPETEVKESRDRVRAALQTAGFEFPARRITVNLAPADLPKGSGRFDLPIALGILVASGQLACECLSTYEFAGELALTGALRPIRAALATSLAARDAGRACIVPVENAAEAARIRGSTVLAASDLLEICAHLSGHTLIQPYVSAEPTAAFNRCLELSEVKGQQSAKRALEIAAAGQHALLMVGPPGVGKSMLAQRLPSLLPLMTEEEALETAIIHSVADADWCADRWRNRPFRAPHHSASYAALVGGGSPPKPGEVSRAHRGVLFLDELPEFQRRALEALREPLENGKVVVSRAAMSCEFPANFQLVAAMNPCPCGFFGQPQQKCRCSSAQIERYRARLSGPLLDRIDLRLELALLSPDELERLPDGETSAVVRERVSAAWECQRQRQRCGNGRLSARDIEHYCRVEEEGRELLRRAAVISALSARGYHRILRVARTIADLRGGSTLSASDVAEAIQYRRSLDLNPTCFTGSR